MQMVKEVWNQLETQLHQPYMKEWESVHRKNRQYEVNWVGFLLGWKINLSVSNAQQPMFPKYKPETDS